MNFFYTDAQGSVIGPVTREQLQQLFDSGLLPDGSQGCYQGSEDWQPVSHFIKVSKKPIPPAKSSSVATQPTAPHEGSLTYNQGAGIIVLLSIGILLLIISLLHSNPRFEYKISSPSDDFFETEMTVLGRDGWEIVSARRASSKLSSACYEVILKRRLP